MKYIMYLINKKKIKLAKLILSFYPFYLLNPHLKLRFRYILSLDKNYYSLLKFDKYITNINKISSKILLNDLFFLSILYAEKTQNIDIIFSSKREYLTKYNKYLYFMYKNNLVKAFFINQFLYLNTKNNKDCILFNKRSVLKDTIRKIIIKNDPFIGDEIRFSRYYHFFYHLIQQTHKLDIIFSCDPRMIAFLSEQYPKLSFITNNQINSYKNYKIITISSMLYMLCLKLSIKNKSDFLYFSSNLNYFNIKNKYSYKEVYINKLIVGLSWRSFLWRWDRVATFFNLEEFYFLFNRSDIEIIICQYDKLSKQELSFLSKFNNCHLVDIDQMNDIKSTAKLYASVDLMITAPSYTSDLSASVGTDTVILSKNNFSNIFSDKEHNIFLGKKTKVICVKDANDLRNKINIEISKKYKK